ncbi:MAG: ABC transporter permease [Thermoleophilia bacterium]
MRDVLRIARKDLLLLRRAPALALGLIVYPIVVAVLVGLVVRYAGERPRVALVDLDGLPATLTVAGQAFDPAEVIVRAAEDVEIVRMDEARAERELANGRVLGVIVIPDGFADRLRGLTEQPEVLVRVTRSGLGTRISEQAQALVYATNRRLQEAYVAANLDYIRLLREGGRLELGGLDLELLGLERARAMLDEAAASAPGVAAPAARVAQFLSLTDLALDRTGDALRATANPIELRIDRGGGRSDLLSTRVQSYALALAVAFVAVLLASASLAAERDENVLARIVRERIGLGRVVAAKVVLVTAVAGALGVGLALAFAVTVDLGDVAGGQPWARFPLVVLGVALTAAACGAAGAGVGAVARDSRAATLIAFLAALPVALLALVPAAAIGAAVHVGDAFPLVHATALLDAALADAEPAARVAREAGWLVGLGLAYGLTARTLGRRVRG